MEHEIVRKTTGIAPDRLYERTGLNLVQRRKLCIEHDLLTTNDMYVVLNWLYRGGRFWKLGHLCGTVVCCQQTLAPEFIGVKKDVVTNCDRMIIG